MEPQSIMNKKGIRLLTFLIALLIFYPSDAQRIWEQRKGSLRTQGNLGGGYLFAQKQIVAYLNGEAEVFFEDLFAYTGGVCFSFSTLQKDQAGIKVNHALFSGANFHFLKPGRWDPYIGVAPGVAVVRSVYRGDDELKLSPYVVAPIISGQIGCNFYVSTLLHFFVKVQGVTGQMLSKSPGASQRMDELKFMGGLGWNLRLWKPKARDI
ncbi:MAG: hypothetical protein IPP77_10125 [Bacteroidetes bacterium]|nr:hypothetical protein [Bacteroidota bacterium]